MADTLLKCTTRHVRLFTARVENDDLVPDPDQLTLDLDPDNEFLWSDSALTCVQKRFKGLWMPRPVENSAITASAASERSWRVRSDGCCRQES